MGNLKDHMMEAIAMHGNGNYAYIDTIQEAKKVLVDEFDSTMFTIAKDVKFQVEFNPETISAYRLIGYDTRRLNNEDFNDDTKDAGEIGSGHSVTVFYELIPAALSIDNGLVDSLRYSDIVTTGSDDFMTVKIRYKAPDGDESKLVEHIVGAKALQNTVSESFKFASAIVEFGLIVTDSNFKGSSSLETVLSRASTSTGEDEFGLRAEFVELVQKYGRIVGD
jgi:Ca-activated chloride channel family protein